MDNTPAQVTAPDDFGTLKLVPLSRIRLDGGTQSRAATSQRVIAEYAELIAAGVELQPPKLFEDDTGDFWVGDGHHTILGEQRRGREAVLSRVRPGTRRDAILYSVGANHAHGLRRTRADKVHAVGMMLTDPEWSTWSDREIARQCNVSHPFVAQVRARASRPVTKTGAQRGTNDAGMPEPDTNTRRSSHPVVGRFQRCVCELVAETELRWRDDVAALKALERLTRYVQFATATLKSRAEARSGQPVQLQPVAPAPKSTPTADAIMAEAFGLSVVCDEGQPAASTEPTSAPEPMTEDQVLRLLCGSGVRRVDADDGEGDEPVLDERDQLDDEGEVDDLEGDVSESEDEPLDDFPDDDDQPDTDDDGYATAARRYREERWEREP